MLNQGVILSAKNISKKYYKHKALLNQNAKNENEFWALKNISFELHKGQILGIIGQNGAGKSTLLKILSEIIPPTDGSIEYEGSILSILDIGTGFHPDLSGYDNIFLNSAILGTKKKDLLEKIPELVAFSGIGEFINEPVKNYSNGMYLRLALSIALFTNNTILLLDEVISVGDAEFQNRAMKKIKELVAEGRSCIMISHDLPSIISLCDSCLFMDKGEIAFFGKSKKVVEDYLDKVNSNITNSHKVIVDHPKCRFKNIEMNKTVFPINEKILISISYEKKVEEDIDIVLNIRNYTSLVMSDCAIYREGYVPQKTKPGIYETTCQIPANLFNTGTFFIDLIFGDKVSSLLTIKSAVKFNVQFPEWEKNKKWTEAEEGTPFRPICDWVTVKQES